MKNDTIMKGWQCPLCGRVYSPYQEMCLYCGQNTNTSIYTNKVEQLPPNLYPNEASTIDWDKYKINYTSTNTAKQVAYRINAKNGENTNASTV